MSYQYQRAALGQAVGLGCLYDARTDSFLEVSALQRQAPNDVISTTLQSNTLFSYIEDDSFSAKCAALDIEPDLAASIAAGLVMPKGVSCYLNTVRDTNKIVQSALLVRETSHQDMLGLIPCRERQLLALDAVSSSNATHVVVGIDWGTHSIVSVETQVKDDEERGDAMNSLKLLLSGLEMALAPLYDLEWSTLRAGTKNVNVKMTSSLTPGLSSIVIYKDWLSKCGLLMKDMQEAAAYFQLGEKAVPVSYTLMGVETLAMILAQNLPRPVIMHPSPDMLREFLQLQDELQADLQTLNDHQNIFLEKEIYMKPGTTQLMSRTLLSTQEAKVASKKKFAAALEAVRAGMLASADALIEANQIAKKATLPQDAGEFLSAEVKRLRFIGEAVALGATYFGFNGLNLDASLDQTQGSTELSCVMRFSKLAMTDEQTWDASVALFRRVIEENKTARGAGLFAIEDADANVGKTATAKATISTYANGGEISDDLLLEETILSGTCFARCPTASLDTKNKERPYKRRPIKLACPGEGCDPEVKCEWTCRECLEPLEFGYTDTYIYCKCGRAEYDKFEFRCNGHEHGPGFDRYASDELLDLLKALKKVESLNILILGETGVGKSTFINAFVNYLNFETLEQAKRENKLNWVIPCSFDTQTMDRSRPDGQIQQVKIDIGKGTRDDEKDGSAGDSATQETTVYPITIGELTIRLIDTPGIGDTRGLSQDKKNMADVLSTLSSYDDLHGILILLKPNNARLNISFKFCIQELLTHLHKSAAENMVFGFTNTRISNYTPGDTYGPLSTLLAKHPDIGLKLNMQTAYCFDSESFRYLAAIKNGHTLPNEEDFRRSWEHSRHEAWRLVKYFQTLTPHMVKSTISLNGARRLIEELTKPMTEISQLIRVNIAMMQDKAQELQDTRLTGKKLRQRLTLQRMHIRTKPRTVCKNSDCHEFKDDGSGENRVLTVYKSICHEVCYLKDVAADQIAHPSLQKCAAFRGELFCKRCGHHWQEHLHVLYELEEYMGTVTDATIQLQLEANATDVQRRQATIQQAETLVKEYQEEHRQIKLATARFVLFLKERCMTAINDATVDYLNMLISDEEAKVQIAGGNDKKLKDLRKDLQQHEELVRTMTADIQDNKRVGRADGVLTEEGVDRQVRKLYALPHFGKNLEGIKDDISFAHAATYRERPYRIQRRHDAVQYMRHTPMPHSPVGPWVHSPHEHHQPAAKRHRSGDPKKLTKSVSEDVAVSRDSSKGGGSRGFWGYFWK